MKLLKMYFDETACPSDECVMVDLDVMTVKYVYNKAAALMNNEDVLSYVYSKRDGMMRDISEFKAGSREELTAALAAADAFEPDSELHRPAGVKTARRIAELENSLARWRALAGMARKAFELEDGGRS